MAGWSACTTCSGGPAGRRSASGTPVCVRRNRGHALGKWLKAAVALHVLDRWDGVTAFTTSNAASNDAMLGINTAMGYVLRSASSTWEVPVADVARWAAQRT